MSEFFFEGAHDAGDLADVYSDEPGAGLGHSDNYSDNYSDSYGDDHFGDDRAFDPDGFEPAGAEGAEGAGDGLLDGLDIDFESLTNLADLAFDASYDLIGSDPDENGWWDALTSEHNHDAAYDEVSYDVDPNPYVAH
jgi:hypothetical protein